MWPTIIMLVAMFLVLWLTMIRPQQKKQRQIREFQNSLKEGDRVVVGGGVHGTVKRVDLEKNIVEVEVARGVVLSVDKGYVFGNVGTQQPNA